MWDFLFFLGLGLLVLFLIYKLFGGLLQLLQSLINLILSILSSIGRILMRILRLSILFFIISFLFSGSGEVFWMVRFAVSVAIASVAYLCMHLMNIPHTKGRSSGGGSRPYGYLTSEPVSINGQYDEVRYFYNLANGIEYPVSANGNVTINGRTYNVYDLI